MATQPSLLEQLLEVSRLSTGSPDTFTNTGALWHPPGAQGIYGGICIAQSLTAAQATVPPNFFPHSSHGQFILAGRPDEKIVFHVTRIRDGKSFATRSVSACQQERVIFSALISFATSVKSTRRQINHHETMPQDVPSPPRYNHSRKAFQNFDGNTPPFLTKKVGIANMNSVNPHEKRIHQWNKASQKISTSGGIYAHLAALAYICDNYFIGTIPHVHGIWDFVKPPLTEFDVVGQDLPQEPQQHFRVPGSGEAINSTHDQEGERLRIDMMVTLNHTMFFHAPKAVRADEWMLSELSSHWAGEGRGVSMQKIWSQDGVLLATCVQEGIVRLADQSHVHNFGGKPKSRL
ncbi:acyl-CoA thioesterase II [Exophiala spinifera]|uniref:Acyl-CoA thioesterase II n=1 Tax=Exophiala spinifera TaxID=91928 RepID=A0A0D2BIL6_9EURO|nr:acyl-CoA thioesterase II [Exophiala spinifera]KIW18425.1 acyl-CoA thioesterase II [Exophiala spinifera]